MRTSILVLVIIGGALGFGVGVKVARNPPEVASPKLVVPRAATPIQVDGEPEDAAWTAKELLRTPAYSERPYSDARFTVRDGNLYVLLYAADEDLHAARASHDQPLWGADAMRVVLTPLKGGREYVVEVSPAGTITDYAQTANGPPDLAWESGAKVGVDLDGTLDETSDMDEEWVAELSIPLSSLGSLEPARTLGLRVERTDLSKGSSGALMSWSPPGGRVTLAD
jgi:hypothetical protein